MAGGGRKSKVYVVGAEYCDSKPVILAMTQNVAVKPVESPNINVSDREKKSTISFEVKDRSSKHGIHMKYVLLDNHCDKIILSFQDKVSSPHHRWQVFRGRNEDEKELLFTVKESKIIGSNGDLHVFLAKNEEEKTYNFRVRSSSDIFFVEDSRSETLGKIYESTVEVYPGVDRAFIVSLYIILNGMKQPRLKKREIAKLFGQGCLIAAGVAVGF